MDQDNNNPTEGTFTLSDEKVMAMSSYLTQCHQEGKLNDNQYQFYLNQLWDHDSSFENNMHVLNLWEGFETYQTQQNQQEEQNKHLFQEQQKSLQNTVQNSQQKIREYQDQIGLFQKEISELTPSFENARNRYEQFPDNPRLQAEFQKQQEPIDTLQSQILNLQNLIETTQQEIILWETQLSDLHSQV